MSHHPHHHRYCSHCGWGFSFNAWASSRFCPGCGKRVSRTNSSGSTPDVVMGKAVRMRGPAPSAKGKFAGLHLDRAKISRMAENLTDWARRHPYLAALMFVAGGVGMILAGPVVTACGAAIAALGGTIIKTSIISGLILAVLAACAAQPGDSETAQPGAAGIVIALAGTALGLVVAAFGAILAVLGAMLTGSGYVILAAVLLLLVLRAGTAIYNHRQQISELARTMRDRFRRLPACEKAGILPDGCKWDVNSLLAQVDAQLVRNSRFQN